MKSLLKKVFKHWETFLLVFIGLPSTYDNTITGVMLIVIVVVDALAQRRSVEMSRRKRLLSRTAENAAEGGSKA